MTDTRQVIYLQPSAPPKPTFGSACNGCGVCCQLEPCPLGALLSGKRSGACDALRWNAQDHRYWCGAVLDSTDVLRHALPSRMRALAPMLGRPLELVAARWIAAGQGCDCDLEAHPQALPPEQDMHAPGSQTRAQTRQD